MNTKHSERDAFDRLNRLMRRNREISRRVSNQGVIVVNYAFDREMKCRMCKPCFHCAEFISSRQTVKKVYWIDDNGLWNVCSGNNICCGARKSSGERR